MYENPLNNFIDLFCLEAYCGYAGHLKINCSKFSTNFDLIINGNQKPEWRLETESAAWRLQHNGVFMTGSYEDEEHNDEYLAFLVGKKITQIVHIIGIDYSVVFDDGYQIDIFNQGIDFPAFKVYDSNKEKHLLISQDGTWLPYVAEEFTTQEEMMSLHSEQAHERWENIVPQESFDNHCRNCAYFLSITGRFYFWDYGLCSNHLSLYDGKVVGVKSSCENYSLDLNLDE
ncbi:hypothetical protein AD998_10810 [bacterium 336/3]|nr:hypothetical protein AD998_10810 [bacterium 336/3]